MRGICTMYVKFLPADSCSAVLQENGHSETAVPGITKKLQEVTSNNTTQSPVSLSNIITLNNVSGTSQQWYPPLHISRWVRFLDFISVGYVMWRKTVRHKSLVTCPPLDQYKAKELTDCIKRNALKQTIVSRTANVTDKILLSVTYCILCSCSEIICNLIYFAQEQTYLHMMRH